jgi:hypothetical protein
MSRAETLCVAGLVISSGSVVVQRFSMKSVVRHRKVLDPILDADRASNWQAY